MECLVLMIFIGILLGCVAADVSILYALMAGYILFVLYAKKKGFSFGEVLGMSIEGVKTVKNILITFFLIGTLTALWRAGGTIPAIVCYSIKVMRPGLFLVIAFLLNSIVSFLTGTSFGTAATMGTICMTMGRALELDPVMMGGAILSGVFFGDRCSPVSTSALLVAELTKTDLYENIKNMLKTALVPFLVTCLIYTIYGWYAATKGNGMPEIYSIFAEEFQMGLLTLLPAVLILLLSLWKVNVKKTMLASILAAVFVCITCQKLSFGEIVCFSVFGFKTSNGALAPMINGGGIVSMLRVAAIVCISSSYAGIFQKTGLLEPICRLIDGMGKRFSTYTVVLLTSIAASAVSCNQTLSIMLTEQLCSHIEKEKCRRALYLEDSVVIVAPLIPWSIAGAVPLATVGAPTASLMTSFFLFLIPIWELMTQRRKV